MSDTQADLKLRFFGVKFADPKEFVWAAAKWGGTPQKMTAFNEADSYTSSTIHYGGRSLLIEGVRTCVFYIDQVYKQFVDPAALIVYVFPSVFEMQCMAADDLAVFRRAIEHCPPKQPPVYVLNNWQVDLPHINTIDCDAVEKRHGVRPDLVTSLGRRPMAEQEASFYRFLDFVLKRCQPEAPHAG